MNESTDQRMDQRLDERMDRRIGSLLRLVEFSDSALPVGSFTFSCGLETAAGQGLVCDAATLEEYVLTFVRQTAFSDGVAALCAYRAAAAKELHMVFEADARVWSSKAGRENRLMTQRMGRKLTELAGRLIDDERLAAWSEAVAAERTPGCWPAAQGVLFAAAGMDAESLFAAHLYGTASMILNAALRCVRVSHFDTQLILYNLCCRSGSLYREVSSLSLDEMNIFTPEADILAALHERGPMRMFMS